MAAAIILLREESLAGVILPVEVIPLVKDTAAVIIPLREESTAEVIPIVAGPPTSFQAAKASRRLLHAIRMGGSSGVPQRSEISSG